MELLKQSPSLILSPCHPLAEVYQPLASELYNVAFASLWNVLTDKNKDYIIQYLTKAINDNQDVPLTVL